MYISLFVIDKHFTYCSITHVYFLETQRDFNTQWRHRWRHGWLRIHLLCDQQRHAYCWSTHLHFVTKIVFLFLSISLARSLLISFYVCPFCSSCKRKSSSIFLSHISSHSILLSLSLSHCFRMIAATSKTVAFNNSNPPPSDDDVLERSHAQKIENKKSIKNRSQLRKFDWHKQLQCCRRCCRLKFFSKPLSSK